MNPSEYGKDDKGHKQGSLTPLSRIRFDDINMGFADMLNRDIRKMRRGRQAAIKQGEVYEVDPLTIEAAEELSLMITYATANENGIVIRQRTKTFDAGTSTCAGCKNQVKLYRASLCRPCYAERLGWQSIKKK